MIKHAFLGVVQGLTEFLPVSSSGHLVIAQRALGIGENGVALELVLHLGTLVAVCIFLRREIRSLFTDRKLAGLVLITTAVTGIIGIAGHKFFADLFSRPELIAQQLIFNGLVLLLTRWFVSGSRERLNAGDAVVTGVTQALAIIPAISRSGMTIAALLFRKVDRKLCFTFSFLVSIPAIIGASLFEFKEIGAVVQADFASLAVGFLFSLFSGMAALWLLRKLLVNNKFHYFGYYCLGLAALLMILAK